MSKEDTRSKKELINDLVNQKIRDGFDVSDKQGRIALNKAVRSELKLPNGWSTGINKVIDTARTELKIQVDPKDKSNEIQGFEVNMESPDATPETNPEISQPLSLVGSPPQLTVPNSKPVLPSDYSSESEAPAKIVLSPEQAESQERFFKKIFGFASDVYIALGLVETDDEEELKEFQKPKPLKEFKADMEELGGELNQLMMAYGMQLPKYLDLIAFGVSIFTVMGTPLLKKFAMGGNENPKPNYEESLDDVEVNI